MWKPSSEVAIITLCVAVAGSWLAGGCTGAHDGTDGQNASTVASSEPGSTGCTRTLDPNGCCERAQGSGSPCTISGHPPACHGGGPSCVGAPEGGATANDGGAGTDAAKSPETGVPAAPVGPSGRPFQLALYHGGVSQRLTPTQYRNYLAGLAAFVAKRHIDKVFVDVAGYDAMPYKSPEPLADFLNALPANVIVGAVLEINPKYDFQYDNPLLAGGLRCVDKVTPSGVCAGTDDPARFASGCPNNMEKAYDLLAKANELALKHKSGTTLFTDFIADKENAGLYGGRVCNFIESAKTYIVPGLPSGFRGASSPQEKLDLVRVGFAGEGSMNAPALLTKPICGGPGTDTSCQNYPYDVKNVEAFPELYWYMQELKEKGCIGCDHTLTASDLAATRPNECAACADPKCQSTAKFFQTDAPYDQCLRSGCPSSCCKCLGCIPCGHDAQGRTPNPAIMYQAYLNQPAAMADAVVAALGNLALLGNLTQANTWSMFSIELAHNWRNLRDPMSGKLYAADGADSTSSDTCVARKNGGDICGTFDGFGNWSWAAFEQFLLEYHRRTGITKLAIYEWQFVFPEWL